MRNKVLVIFFAGIFSMVLLKAAYG